MKPPSHAIFLSAGDTWTEPGQPDQWGVMLGEPDQCKRMPLILHRETGLVFGMAQDENHPHDRIRVYAILVGQTQDRLGNTRKIGRIASDKVGRKSIIVYLMCIGAWEGGENVGSQKESATARRS